MAVPRDCDEQPVQHFGALTADLYALAEWLRPCQIETAVIESTGIYGIALFEVLKSVALTSGWSMPHDARQVLGRKTDVQDGQWLQELHTSD